MCETFRALVVDLGALYAFTESEEISIQPSSPNFDAA